MYVPWYDRTNIRFVQSQKAKQGINLTRDEAVIWLRYLYSPIERLRYVAKNEKSN